MFKTNTEHSMKMQKTFLLLVTVLFLFSCVADEKEALSTSHLNLTPHPQYVNLKGEELNLSKGLRFTTNLSDSAQYRHKRASR